MRIIWLYKRWQPLYEVVRTNVMPDVEFVQSISPDLERDRFLDPSVRNLIVLDDPMSATAKEPHL